MLQDDYIIIRKGIKPDPKQDREHKMNIEDLFLNRFYSFEEKERETNPSAFLLTEKESALLENAIICMERAGAPLWDAIDESKNPELVKAMVNNVFEAFKAQRLSIKKLEALSDKFTTSLFWSITPEFSKDTDKNGVIVASTPFLFKVTISTDENFKNLNLPEKHPFFTAETMQERAQALGLSDLYLYINRFDLGILEVLNMLFKIKGAEQTAEVLQTTKKSGNFIYIANSRIMTAPNRINARKGKKRKEIDEKGRQISVAEYATNSNLTISLTDFLPEPENLLSVGDPNTDKLLKQAQLIAMQTGKQEFNITINDFMEFRGLSDRKSAIDKADKAADMLDKMRFRLEEDTEDIKAGVNIHYVQTSGLIIQSGRAGSVIHIEFSNKVFKHLERLAKSGQQIAQYDKNIMKLPDNQRTAYQIADIMENHLRMNAGKKNAHIIGIDKILSFCSYLPLYPEFPEDAGKDNYLRFKSEAPERIIKPFIKGLDFITKGTQKNKDYQILEHYTFRHSRGEALTDAELTEALKDYKKFTALNIEFKFVNEPDYKHLIEAKEKQQEKAEKKKSNNKK